MKLNSSDGGELMEVSSVRSEAGHVIVAGTIMGAMPIEAILTPAELRKAFGLLSPGLVWALVLMLFKKQPDMRGSGQ